MQNTNTTIKRALLSVSKKDGIVEFAKELIALDIEILSTGGTATLLRQHHIPVIEVADYTGFPEIMDGRVKTLHPKIHGGLLARRGTDEPVIENLGISLIDLLVVNLYPFQEVIAKPDCDLPTAIENIDIGGPTLLRAAAKNYQAVTVIVDHADYQMVLNEMRYQNNTRLETRFYLASKAFAHTAQYDAAISNYFKKITHANKSAEPMQVFPEIYAPVYHKKQDLRYGENPHQQAALYLDANFTEASAATAKQLQGKELSFNNLLDADTALECVKNFNDSPACVIVKHANPCGVALGNNLLEAYQRAYTTDPVSAFGGIIAFNQIVDGKTAQTIIEQQFAEVIIAPEFEMNAQEIFAAKPNIRILCCGKWQKNSVPDLDYKKIKGGLLIQQQDAIAYHPEQLQVVTKRAPTAQELNDLLFAWQIVKYIKSNAIVYAKDGMTIGIGAGQMSRVYSARIAAIKAEDAGLTLAGSVMASDAFFPFRDGIDTAAKAGITAVIHPGGSMRDAEVIDAANQANMAMLFTGIRHFRH